MTRYILLLIGVVCYTGNLMAANWRPPERFLHAVRYVESSHGKFTYGDNGQSLGDFQISEAAWHDVSEWRKQRQLRTYEYKTHVWNRAINRAYAADYLTIIYAELKKKLNRPPTVGEVYAAYNMGLGTFAQCGYKLARVNPVTKKKVQQIKEIMRSAKTD